MSIVNGLLFLSFLNMHSFTWQGPDPSAAAFKGQSFTYTLSARATAGNLNLSSFDPFPFSVEYSSKLIHGSKPFGAKLDFGYAQPFYGEQGLYLRSVYGFYRLNVAGTLEARAGWITLPFNEEWGTPFAFRAHGLDYRGITAIQLGSVWYTMPVDFVPSGGLGVAVQHKFPFGLELGAGYSFLPGALYAQAAFEYKKSDMFFRPEVKWMQFDAEDVELDAYSGTGSTTADGKGMMLLQASLLAGVGDLFFDGRFGIFRFNKGDFSVAEGSAGWWANIGGGYIIHGKEHHFLQSLVLRADVSFRNTDRTDMDEGNMMGMLSASVLVLRHLEASVALGTRFPSQDGVDPKSYFSVGLGYKMKISL